MTLNDGTRSCSIYQAADVDLRRECSEIHILVLERTENLNKLAIDCRK